MLPNQYETEAADHLEATDHIVPLADFKWPTTRESVTSLSTVRHPSNEQVIRGATALTLPTIVGDLSKAQSHKSVSMRFEIAFVGNDNMDVHYTGFDYKPIAILSNVGASLSEAVEYYRGRENKIVLYATPSGHYWICTFGANII